MLWYLLDQLLDVLFNGDGIWVKGLVQGEELVMIDIWGNMIFDCVSRGISEFWWFRKLLIVVRCVWCVEMVFYDGVVMVLIFVQSF